MKIVIDTKHPDTIHVTVTTPMSERSATIKAESLYGVPCWVFREYEDKPITMGRYDHPWATTLFEALERLGVFS